MTAVLPRDAMYDPSAYIAASSEALKRKQQVLAHSLLRCARHLGADIPEEQVERYRLSEDQLLGRGVLYQRNIKVVDLLHDHFGSAPLRILDVGGHYGFLSHMIPQHDYFLCDPLFNEMRTEDLLERAATFDVVVATHVIEHIPDPDKAAFFGTLVALARHGVILCNPLDTGGAVARQEFLLDVYGPLDWIVEHLECGTPSRDVFEGFARDHNLTLSSYANGNHFLSMAMFAMQNFAEAAKDPEITKRNGKIVRYINKRYRELDSEDHFRDYAFVFVKPDAPVPPHG